MTNYGEAVGPNFGYNGGGYLLDGQPVSVWRDCASDQGANHGLYCSLRIPDPGPPPFTGIDAVEKSLNASLRAAGFGWKEEAAIWLPAMVVPGQSGSTRYTNLKGGASACRVLVTQPNEYNGFTGSVLVCTGSNGLSTVFRSVGATKAALAEFWPSGPTAEHHDLPWELDATHTTTPGIFSTGVYGSANTDQGPVGGAIFAMVQPDPTGHPAWVLASVSGAKTIGGLRVASIIESLDDGQTWNFLAYVNDSTDFTPAVAVLEPTLIHRKSSGELMCWFRMGDDTRAYRIGSLDGTTWSDPIVSLATAFPGGTSGQPWSIEVSNGDGTFTMFHAVRPPDFGRMLLVYASHDGGLSWEGPQILSAGTGTLVGAPPQWWLDQGGGLAGQSTYGQFVEKQTRIPGVRDGVIGAFFSFSNQTGSARDGIAAASTNYYMEMVNPR